MLSIRYHDTQRLAAEALLQVADTLAVPAKLNGGAVPTSLNVVGPKRDPRGNGQR